MNILAIIPARGGSKGLPGKNTKQLGNQPLISYTINQAIKCDCFTKIIVSTDDDTIAKIARNFGAEIPFTRPVELATDSATSISVVQHAVNFLEEKREFFDAVCLLQPTSPFRESGFINKAISVFIKKKSDSLVSVIQVPHEYNPHWVFEGNEKGFLHVATGEKEIITRRQELPKAFIRDGSIYVTKVETIKNGTLYGDSISYVESNPELYINIDTAADWEKAEEKLPTILRFI
jgi:N-acylneuraminate cytidylyltransferase